MAASAAPATSTSRPKWLPGLVKLLILITIGMAIGLTYRVYAVHNDSGGFGIPGLDGGNSLQVPAPSTTSGGGGTTAPASPSSTDDPKADAIDTANATSEGQRLKGEGYSPVTVLVPGTDNRSGASKFLDSVTARAGTYVVYRKDTTVVVGPNRSSTPDQLVMVNTGTSRDGEVVGYYQTFGDGRAAVCAKSSAFDLSDKSNWYHVTTWLHGKGLDTYTPVNHDDVTQIPVGVTIQCGAPDPSTNEMQ